MGERLEQLGFMILEKLKNYLEIATNNFKDSIQTKQNEYEVINLIESLLFPAYLWAYIQLKDACYHLNLESSELGKHISEKRHYFAHFLEKVIKKGAGYGMSLGKGVEGPLITCWIELPKKSAKLNIVTVELDRGNKITRIKEFQFLDVINEEIAQIKELAQSKGITSTID